jgi:hypothetical protein
MIEALACFTEIGDTLVTRPRFLLAVSDIHLFYYSSSSSS